MYNYTLRYPVSSFSSHMGPYPVAKQVPHPDRVAPDGRQPVRISSENKSVNIASFSHIGIREFLRLQF